MKFCANSIFGTLYRSSRNNDSAQCSYCMHESFILCYLIPNFLLIRSVKKKWTRPYIPVQTPRDWHDLVNRKVLMSEIFSCLCLILLRMKYFDPKAFLVLVDADCPRNLFLNPVTLECVLCNQKEIHRSLGQVL